jgi:hypothetical protein
VAPNRCIGCVTPHTAKIPIPDTPGTGRRSWPPAGFAISLLYLADVTAITRTLRAIGRDRTRMLSYLPL